MNERLHYGVTIIDEQDKIKKEHYKDYVDKELRRAADDHPYTITRPPLFLRRLYSRKYNGDIHDRTYLSN